MQIENSPTPLQVVAANNPFTTNTLTLDVPEGQTIAEILNLVQPDPILRRHAHVYIGDQYIKPEYYGVVRPKRGHLISLRIVPTDSGGGGKSPLRIVLLIAVVAAALTVPALLGPGLASTSVFAIGGTTVLTVGQLAAGATLILGGLLVNALVPPPRPRISEHSPSSVEEDSKAFSFTGSKNAAEPYGVVPRVFGIHRMTPPMAALPFTEIVGNDQFIRLAFNWGYGPLEITDLKIGETAIDQFQGVEIETIQDKSATDKLTLFPNQVTEESLNIELLSQIWQVRTTQPDTDEASIDITFPRGLYKFKLTTPDPVKQFQAVAFEVQIAVAGSGTWESGGAIGADTITLDAETTGTDADDIERWDRLEVNRFTGEPTVRKGQPITYAPADSVAIRVTRSNPTPSDNTMVASIATISIRTGVTQFVGGDIFANLATSVATGFAVTPGTGLELNIASGTLTASTFTYSAKTTSPIVRSRRMAFPSRGSWDIRLKRSTADLSPSVTDRSDASTWSRVRSITNEDPIVHEGITVTALRIKASDQLSGVVDTFNAIAAARILDRTGGTWKVQKSSNPAAAFRDVLQGKANARPVADSRLDFTSLEAWHTFCANQGLEFNMIRDFRTSVTETIRDICAIGRATLNIRDGKWGVVFDVQKFTPVQMFTNRNSGGFQGRKIFTEMPHGFRARFINRDEGWQSDERIVLDDGYVLENPGPGETLATKFEEMQLPGITDPEHAWKDARYHIAVARLRPEIYFINTDIEHLVAKRGDLVTLVHDVPLIGLGAVRTKSLIDNGTHYTGIIVDSRLPVEVGQSYSMRFRPDTQTQVVHRVDGQAFVDSEGLAQQFTFVTPFTIAGSDLKVDDLAGYGLTGSEALNCVVKGIEPHEDLTATIELVPQSPEVYNSDQGTIPPFDSLITPPPGSLVPSIVSILSDENVLAIGTDGSFSPQMVLSFGFTQFRPVDAKSIEIQFRVDASSDPDASTDYESISVGGAAAEAVIQNVAQGETYEIRTRFIFADDSRGNFSSIITHIVIGTDLKPENVTELFLEGNRLTWTFPIRHVDHDGYLIRTVTGNNPNWNIGVQVHEGVHPNSFFDLDSILVDGGTRTFMVKAIDTAKNESLDPAALVIGLGDPITDNIVSTDDKDAAFYPGTIVGGTVNGTDLEADSLTSNLYLPNDLDLYLGGPSEDAELYLPGDFDEMSYTTTSNFPSNAMSEIVLALTSTGIYALAYRFGTTGVFNGIKNPFPGRVAVPTGFNQIELTYTAEGGSQRAVITNFDVIYDVPTLQESIDDFDLLAGGSRLPITLTYDSIKNVSITLQDVGTPVTVKIQDKNATTGPLVQAFDSGGTGVTATIDAIVQGVAG